MDDTALLPTATALMRLPEILLPVGTPPLLILPPAVAVTAPVLICVEVRLVLAANWPGRATMLIWLTALLP
ncbi:hypothetical protein D3C71_1860920 [compost metagenome]